ncbi:efflux RND transporter periplasmic adaptor subunit [Actomonas aquatica]|uniref:Efflux RND transporter periplasmic adaptor subunit n=1 Tax=Actomonas aquatica TaxID=2866162 RepID=A0ABZ1CBH8_9BACT|nr:efflux RND transporter periplasmic adaptor subunit [Opitutus sp. WL0086]WRQ88911.1 efflux RND transporter periplasmic adaptor subunit [Opitutus sp. WL0086]
MKTRPFLFSLSLLLATSCLNAQSHDHDHGAAALDDDHHDEDIVQLSPAVLREFDLELGPIGPGALHETVVLPGEIEFNREHTAIITPRYDATVTRIEVRLADRVQRGQVLARLENTDTLRPFEVTAPIDGTVVSYELTPGQAVAAGTPLFTIADLSTVWADLRIYQRDLDQIHEGQTVRVSSRHGITPFDGTLSYIAPTIDEHTRTGLARVVVANPDGRWKPGQFVRGTVSIEEHPVDLWLPRSAVLTYEEQTVVFVQTEEGFAPHPVQLGHHDAEGYEVLGGVQAGDIVVLRNAISLKAELSKGAFGGHHH